jgi:hypothetical protein
MYSAACSDRPIRIGHMPPSESGAPEWLADFGLGFQIGQADVAQHMGVKLYQLAAAGDTVFPSLQCVSVNRWIRSAEESAERRPA